MPNSTFENRRYALASALAIIHEPDSDPAAILPAEMEEAVLAIRRLQAGGWHLIHADDLPAGFIPGDVIRHLGNLYDHAADPLPEPTAVLGETPDEMRRRLPMTEPVSHAVARQLGWQEDPTPTTETPQEPTHDADIPWSELDTRMNAVYRSLDDLERTVHGQRLSAEGHARRTTDLEERATRLERITNDNARDAERRLTNLEERADDHDARLDTITETIAGIHNDERRFAEALNLTENRLNRHRDELDYLTGENPTLEAPDDPDQRLGGHDNPHDDDDQAHNDASNETR